MNATETIWRQRLALAAVGTSPLLTGLCIGYALGLRHSLQRALAGKDPHGI